MMNEREQRFRQFELNRFYQDKLPSQDIAKAIKECIQGMSDMKDYDKYQRLIILQCYSTYDLTEEVFPERLFFEYISSWTRSSSTTKHQFLETACSLCECNAIFKEWFVSSSFYITAWNEFKEYQNDNASFVCFFSHLLQTSGEVFLFLQQVQYPVYVLSRMNEDVELVEGLGAFVENPLYQGSWLKEITEFAVSLLIKIDDRTIAALTVLALLIDRVHAGPHIEYIIGHLVPQLAAAFFIDKPMADAALNFLLSLTSYSDEACNQLQTFGVVDEAIEFYSSQRATPPETLFLFLNNMVLSIDIADLLAVNANLADLLHCTFNDGEITEKIAALSLAGAILEKIDASQFSNIFEQFKIDEAIIEFLESGPPDGSKISTAILDIGISCYERCPEKNNIIFAFLHEPQTISVLQDFEESTQELQNLNGKIHSILERLSE